MAKSFDWDTRILSNNNSQVKIKQNRNTCSIQIF